MRAVLFFISLILYASSFAQLKEGFNKEEVRDMIAICNSFSFLDLYASDAEIIPASYKKKYTSGVFGMDNKYQIYQKGPVAVINFRGSTDKKNSWLENIYSAMIPAKGTIKVSGESFDYCFAKDTGAAVHAGYALGIAFLHKDLLDRINNLNRDGIYSFIITGHSQGGAIANMFRAYLENLSHNEVSKKNKFKTYAFAAPMVGNKKFAEEYNARYAAGNSSFNIVNPEDPIPAFPLSYNDTAYLSDNLKTFLFDRESFSFKNMLSDGAVKLFEGSFIGAVKKLGYRASEQISKDLGPVSMPDYVEDINYHKLKNTVKINAFVYPKVLKDSTILKNDSLMKKYSRDSEGNFLNADLYEKESWSYQHRPYNYYVSVLKMHFPNEYKSLKRKHLSD